MKYISVLIMITAMFMQIACKDDTPSKQNRIASASEKPEQKEEAVTKSEPVIEDVIVKETANEPVLIAEAEVEELNVKKEEKPTSKPKVEKAVKATDEKGIVAYVDGKVKKKQVNEPDWNTSVEEKAKVKSRESYRTMKKSRAELELSGMDILRLAPKTTVDLVALYEETKEGKDKTDIKLEEGDIWAQINSSDDDSEFTMDTDIAAAAITGTNFRMSKNGELTEMKVYHGEVKVSNAKEKMDQMTAKSVTDYKEPKKSLGPKKISGPKQVSLEEWVFIVKNMQQITFDKSGKIVSAGEFKATDESERTDWVEWNKKRDRKRGLK